MDYSKTVNLPTTEFPMRANLPQREPEMLKKWQEKKIYAEILKKREGSALYILHDGPPYANGNIHLGHALNKILKDVIVKHKTMMGFKAPYVPGWDCHGLPIELQVVKELGDEAKNTSRIEIRKKCRKYAEKFVKIQMEEFKRLGVFGDYEHPYLTMSNEYEAKILEIFGKLFEKGFITRSKKPIYWCPNCVTALAEAEVEYENHESPSIFVKFAIDGKSLNISGIDAHNLYMIIWTTTPWTLPANLAVCLHPEFTYVIRQFGNEYYLMAEGLVDSFEHITGLKGGKSVEIKRNQLEKIIVFHPFIERQSKVIFGDFVTLDQGTGIVHIAPGHGLEDYLVGLEYGLETLSPVDDEGKFTDEFALMKGVQVFDANEKIIELLKSKNALIKTEVIEHSYPHCWRCKKPLIFRATEQWFMTIDHNELRKKALKAVDETTWIPSWGEQRFRGMVETRPDWCLSRQRSWGVPIPSFKCTKCGKNLMTAETILYFSELSLAKGIDAWYTDDIQELIPKGTKCTCGSTSFEKEFDILDVWFDSGVSHYAVLDSWPDHRWPSDLYLEGSDQHRGWFQSSLWPAIALRDSAPYRTVLTHGFVLDEEGKAMSKSMGNVIPPDDIIKKFGADILRLWVSSEDYRNDVRIGYDMINQIADSYRKIRNTFKYILGNIADFSEKDAVPYNDLADVDKWILHKLHQLHQQVIEAYENFEFHLVYRRILNFCAVELSSIYFDISKDILYIEEKNSVRRRASLTVLHEVYKTLVTLIAPILVFTAEEIWDFAKNEGTIHFQKYYTPSDEFKNESLAKKMEELVEVKKDMLKALEIKRKQKEIGTSVEAHVEIFVKSERLKNLLRELGEEARRFFQVSSLSVCDTKSKDMEEYDIAAIQVRKASGTKCVRCWNYTEDVGRDEKHPQLCARCVKIVEAIIAK